MSKFVRPAAEGADPFGTARLRRGVLDAWGAGPARFREDANAEEDLALGGYRDRLVVELAQNAADAAARAGVPGRLRLTLPPGDRRTLRPRRRQHRRPAGRRPASSRCPPCAPPPSARATTAAVGRFGVGFAAVLAVTDEPAVLGRHGGVRWSLAEARELARGRRRGTAPASATSCAAATATYRCCGCRCPPRAPPPTGTTPSSSCRCATRAAEDLAERLLAAVDDALLLTLPGLAEVVIETPDGVRTADAARADGAVHASSRTPRTAPRRWRTVAAHGGPSSPALLADRPVEERLRPHWSVTWAVPVDADGRPAPPAHRPVVHAPDPHRRAPRHARPAHRLPPAGHRPAGTPRPGRSPTSWWSGRPTRTPELLGAWQPVATGIIDLVPGPLGKGELDGALRGGDPGPAARVPPSCRARPPTAGERRRDGTWTGAAQRPAPRRGRGRGGRGRRHRTGPRRGAAHAAARRAGAPRRAAHPGRRPACRWPRRSTGSPGWSGPRLVAPALRQPRRRRPGPAVRPARAARPTGRTRSAPGRCCCPLPDARTGPRRDASPGSA